MWIGLFEWYLPNGTKIASDNRLESASASCEYLAIGFGFLVVLCVIAEWLIARDQPPYELFLRESAWADAGIAIGIVGEVLFGMWSGHIQTELRDRSNKRVADAIERAANADLARVELEAQLSPRMLNQEQWDLIQSLKGKFSEINIGFETDAEAWWFATELKNAFMSVGIPGVLVPRNATVHSFGNFIFEPEGFDGARPRTVGPLVELFKAEHQLKYGSAAIIGGLPTDILQLAGNDEEALRSLQKTPMIIVGGRFIVPPAHWPKPSKNPQSKIDAAKRESNI